MAASSIPALKSTGWLSVVSLLVLLPDIGAADTAHIAQPWRAEAVVEGRDETYNEERFLNELTFRHSQPRPNAVSNGIRGTGGSVGSRRLYYDFRFRQDFGFRENRNGFLLDIQRSEDLDGAYQRQLVGFRQAIAENTELWLQGDVYSDKSLSDIYFSARHHLDETSWLHVSWILPDAYFNSKTDSPDEFETVPHSWFLQWHRGGAGPGLGTTVSMTLTPASSFISRQENLQVDSESVSAAFTHRQQVADWQITLELDGERTRRHYRLFADGESQTTGFDRNHLRLLAGATWTGHRLKPGFGIAYLDLKEQGFFGRALNDEGRIRRSEPTAFGEFSLPLTSGLSLRPALYLGHAHLRQTFEEQSDKHFDGFIGKLALPFEMMLSREDGAVLTLNPTFYLHESEFGGGNLQLHWPM
ncbi:hypothetical protein MD273_01045 [Marinobacter pelagius]|uniref:hypothetical protein n=1 Tax=Marinobacter sp. C7 TaxID=2951363 RepID=UPI001EF0DFF6|nr:hypothetical protein [Marinobacter sp. C7]MCG7198301.1 hypothetical protein [Marinobacter sp. C7]